MSPRAPVTEQDLVRHPPRERVNLNHPLVRLAELIDLQRLSASMNASFVSGKGEPANAPRLIAGLLYMQHAFDLSDEDVVWQWVQNPYWQVFTGEKYLQAEPPIGPSSLTRWRKRLGEVGVEEFLAESIDAAKRTRVIKPSSAKRVVVDTTVMLTTTGHPTDSRLLERCREDLVKVGARYGVKLRQNYNRQAPRLATQIGRYAHAKQNRWMGKAMRTLRSRVGRVRRDIERQLDTVVDSRRADLQELIAGRTQILTHKTKDKNKLYALHAPETEFQATGKAGTPYEFGVNVSTTRTHRERLKEALEQAVILSDVKPEIAIVDRCYRGAEPDCVKVYQPGLRRAITRALCGMIRRRSAFEPAIGHIKADGRLDKNWLKHALGDAINAVLCGAGHNLRMILSKLRRFYVLVLVALMNRFAASASTP
jgi:transposase, IS5 family